MKQGRFISFEGGEGAGKSTQVQKLATYLKARGIDALCTREVGGTPGAEAIRALWLDKGEGYWDPMTELCLISAARREHLTKVVWPALEQGRWVLSDRFADSTSVYQGLGLGLGLERVKAFYALIADAFDPDMTLLLDLPVATGAARVTARRGPDDRYQQKNTAFHQTLRDGYLELASAHADRFRIIDASLGEEAVFEAIRQAVAALLPA